MPVYKLKSASGEIFEAETEVCAMSVMLQRMMDDGIDSTEDIPLPMVKSNVLAKILDYCRHHKDSPPEEISRPLKSKVLTECGVSEWDNRFVDVPQDHLFELVLAANYMDIKPLLDLTCAKLASLIKDKTPEEIRKEFNIVNDFTPEEEAQVREENKWCEDA
jgi:S-phase kinase-associated protein 1